MTSCGLKLLSLVALHQHSGLTRYRKPLSDRIESFTGFCFYAHARDVNSEDAGDVLTHRVDIRAYLWRFEQDCRIDVDDVQAALADQPHHTREQLQTVRAAPLRILIRKVYADIAFAQRAENRIGYRVGQRVRVRVALGATVRSDVYAT